VINSETTVKNWHRAIIADAEKKLGRSLKDHEREFITSRGGFVALEMIHDTVKASEKPELEFYLNSEAKSTRPVAPASGHSASGGHEAPRP